MKKRAVLIASGGIDSTTLLYKILKEYYTNEEVLVVSFIYNQKHIRELECIKYHCQKLNIEHKIIDLSSFMKDFQSALIQKDLSIPGKEVLGHPQPLSYVPFRNQLFLTIACGIAESIKVTDVYYGAHFSDVYSYYDCSKEFIEKFNSLIFLNRENEIKLLTPFSNYSKAEIVKEGVELKVDYSKTWSCYEGREKACGRCLTCLERIKSFKDNKLKDLIEYETEVDW